MKLLNEAVRGSDGPEYPRGCLAYYSTAQFILESSQPLAEYQQVWGGTQTLNSTGFQDMSQGPRTPSMGTFYLLAIFVLECLFDH